MNKQFRTIYYVVIGVLTLIVLAIIFGVEDIKKIEVNKTSLGVNLGLVLMYIMIIIAFVGVIAIAVKGLINNPKNAKKSFIGLGVILLLFIIGYVLDGGGTKPGWEQFGVASNGTSKAVGGSLIMMYLMLIISVVVAVGGPFLHLLNKKK